MTGVAGRRCLCGIAAAAQFACSVTIMARCDYVSLGGRAQRHGVPASWITESPSQAPSSPSYAAQLRDSSSSHTFITLDFADLLEEFSPSSGAIEKISHAGNI